MNIFIYHKNMKCTSLTGMKDPVREADKKVGKLTHITRNYRQLMLTITIVAIVAMSSNEGWGIKSALAEGSPVLKLKISGHTNAQVCQLSDHIKIRLVNSGAVVPDSRLRIFVHDTEGRELPVDDIKIVVREKRDWQELPLEAVDGSVMGAIGVEGKSHNERHKHGGFVIAKKGSKVWKLRVIFREPGRYQLVATVTPDNGATHLAKPVSLNIEASL